MSEASRILAIDPGNQESGWVLYERGRVEECGIDSNSDLLRLIRSPQYGEMVIGTKKTPGPLYSVKSHIWAALGVAIVFEDRQRVKTIFPSIGGSEA